MGIPDTILFRNEKEALKLCDVGLVCEPDTPDESIMMANALVQSAPLIAGVTDPKTRRELAKLVFTVARGGFRAGSTGSCPTSMLRGTIEFSETPDNA